MLIGIGIRDIVLIEALDLSLSGGLTVLTGETGAGKSILLDALGLALGARAEAGLVRQGRPQAVATAAFALPEGHPAMTCLEDKGLNPEPGEDLVLRRQLSADGRSRAFVNDQPTSVGTLRELGALLVEVHGQHETVGLLDARTHRGLLDSYGRLEGEVAAVGGAWRAMREADAAVEALVAAHASTAEEAGRLTDLLAELDRLNPQAGEEARLAEDRALLGASERALADISAARDAMGGDGIIAKLGQAMRALERARDRAVQAGAGEGAPALGRMAEALAALERTAIEAEESLCALDSAGAAFDFEPGRLESAEERLFALRAAARRLGMAVDDLPAERARIAAALRDLDSSEADLADARKAAAAARAAYAAAAAALTASRRRAAGELQAAVMAELAPLKLDKARFAVRVEAAGEGGASGADRVDFAIATQSDAHLAPLGAVASGGELARVALALKAALAGRGEGPQPVMIFDEVDQGVGGAVADAVGVRLKRLSRAGQVLVVTHSPQIAARADVHWRISKSGEPFRTAVEPLAAPAREEEVARMLAGAQITDAARAAARALMEA